MDRIVIPLTTPAPDVNLQEIKMGRVIGVSGKARAGKDTLFAIAAADGFKKLSFAADLKRRAQVDLGLTDVHTDGALKETVLETLNGNSPRAFLIELGNLYRKYRPTFWVDIVLDTIRRNPDTDFMITDVRYPNEAEALKSVGGLIVRLERHSSRDSMVDDKTKQSISETALDDYKGFDAVLPGELNSVPEDLKNFWSGIKAVEQEKSNVAR